MKVNPQTNINRVRRLSSMTVFKHLGANNCIRLIFTWIVLSPFMEHVDLTNIYNFYFHSFVLLCRVRHVTVEESIQAGTEERIRSARLQIVVVCPILLERIQNRSEHATNLSRQLITDKVLAMMLGVHDNHISELHKSILVSYNQWRKFFVKDQDETFVGELLGAAIGILGTTPPPALRSDKTAFSVHPKKVKLVG